jgi:hypothetical protein
MTTSFTARIDSFASTLGMLCLLAAMPIAAFMFIAPSL